MIGKDRNLIALDMLNIGKAIVGNDNTVLGVRIKANQILKLLYCLFPLSLIPWDPSAHNGVGSNV